MSSFFFFSSRIHLALFGKGGGGGREGASFTPSFIMKKWQEKATHCNEA